MLTLTRTCARACGAGMTIPSAPKRIVATTVLFMVVLLQLEPAGVTPGCGPVAPLAEKVPSTRSSPSLR
jgi:ABC-type Fe3+-hydroxamate transport system substrate-binding protein